VLLVGLLVEAVSSARKSDNNYEYDDMLWFLRLTTLLYKSTVIF